MNPVCNLITDEERKIISNLKSNSKLNFDKSIAHDFLERKGKHLELIEDDVDLNAMLIKKPEYSFLIKVKGDSMINCGIDNTDTLLVDCSIEPKHGDIVVASINGKILVKKLNFSYRETMLLSENENYMPIKVRSGDKFEIWGVAIMVIKDRTL
jgi:SOS-response transcriptional repressor LexA